MGKRRKSSTPWQEPPGWRELGRRQAAAMNAAHAKAERCGAKCRGTGLPCERPVLKGRTRCRLHGGATPRGDDWHKIQWPNPDAPNAALQLARKLDALRHREKLRQRHIDSLSPDERDQFERRSKAQRVVGTTAQREAWKRERKANAELRRSIGRAKPTEPTAEASRLRSTIQEIDARRDELTTQLERLRQENSNGD